MNWPKTMLMVSPEYFEVKYSINPHMLDKDGQLNKIDKTKALQQWTGLKSTFETLGMSVEVIPGQEDLPDMVFCANQTFPFTKNGERHILLSEMDSEYRQPEVQFFESWAKNKTYTIHKLNNKPFEGMGDALWNYETNTIFAGYGFRTTPAVYSEIEKIVDQKIITFELKDSRFYHLDTCLAILNKDTAAYVPEAFTQEGLSTLNQNFSNLIAVPLDEAEAALAGNMCTPNGKDIIIQQGALKTNQALNDNGFNVLEVETSEFLKSGGSVFCMKQLLF